MSEGSHPSLTGFDASVKVLLSNWIGAREPGSDRHREVIELLEDPDRCRRIAYAIHRTGAPGYRGEPGVPE